MDLELSVIGAQVALPEGAAFRSSGGDDRLAELASWWAGVAGTAPPRQVRQLWLPSEPVGWSQADVTVRDWSPPADVAAALEHGVATADAAVDDGVDLVLLTVEDDTDWEVLVAHLLDLDPVEALGWPAARGISDDAWMTRVAAVRDGLRRLRGIHNQPELLLSTLGNTSLAAGTALLVRATARRTPVFVDGPGAAACALLAHRIARPIRSWLQATDAGSDPLHDRVLGDLRLPPLTQFRLTPSSRDDVSPLPDSASSEPRPARADGTSARIALYLLETALTRSLLVADELTDDAFPPADTSSADRTIPDGEATASSTASPQDGQATGPEATGPQGGATSADVGGLQDEEVHAPDAAGALGGANAADAGSLREREATGPDADAPDGDTRG